MAAMATYGEQENAEQAGAAGMLCYGVYCALLRNYAPCFYLRTCATPQHLPVQRRRAVPRRSRQVCTESYQRSASPHVPGTSSEMQRGIPGR